MTALESRNRCSAPDLGSLVTAFCFGDLTAAERNDLVRHIAHCEVCAREVAVLGSAVEFLRTDRAFTEQVLLSSLPGVLGMSDRLHDRFGGHVWFVVGWSAAYAMLHGVSLIAEVGYAFDRFGQYGLSLAPLLAGWIAATTALALWSDWQAVRTGRADGLIRSVAIIVGAALMAIGVLDVLLPNDVLVQARFETHPLHAGIHKFMAYNAAAAIGFVAIPFHFVLALQAELGSTRRALACQLLRGAGWRLLPKGTLYIPVSLLMAALPALLAIGYFGGVHLFDNLLPGPYRGLFMSLVQTRIACYVGTVVIAVAWYHHAYNELKRECIAWERVEPALSQFP